MENCIFCRIAAGEIPAEKVYEDDAVLAFRDLSPQAPVHVLIIPKAHVSGLMEVADLPEGTPARLMRAAAKVAELTGVSASGFRLVSNCGGDAGQTVGHLHFHLLGGGKLSGRMV